MNDELADRPGIAPSMGRGADGELKAGPGPAAGPATPSGPPWPLGAIEEVEGGINPRSGQRMEG